MTMRGFKADPHRRRFKLHATRPPVRSNYWCVTPSLSGLEPGSTVALRPQESASGCAAAEVATRGPSKPRMRWSPLQETQ